MKIINISKKRYGGKAYEKMVERVLSEYNADIVIRNFDTSLFLSKKPTKNITIVHHTGYSFAPWHVKLAAFFLAPVIMCNLRKSDAIVTVSKYWQNYFQERGYKNVYLIYNGFDLNDFNISEGEIDSFKKEYNLIEKPIIYLGNCQKAKGAVESYEILKGLNVYLITSGEPMVKTPALHLNLEYRDYLKLLKASSIVVTMSKFKEGWCRTAHEAMLLKTPVIGSGLGGMRELLEDGKQIICSDFKSLKEKVEYLLNHPAVRQKMGEAGFCFAKEFNLEKFKKDWIELINKLV
jgi:glycosyltransferase involved in cell wall biosynthesis